jgi:ABC-2 type transport system permease protein
VFQRLRPLKWSAWLGWEVQSNWTDPWLFAVYVVLKPVSASLLLLCMYWAAAAVRQVPPEYFSFLYVSNAFYLLVGAISFGMSWAVISDREHYGMLKYMVLSPVRLQTYLVGRGLAGSVQALLGTLITLAVGLAFFPEMREALGRHGVAWGWLAVYLVLGTVMLLAIGLLLAGAVLNMARHAMFLSEGVAGGLFLLSGTVFPIGVLPDWAHPICLSLPTTYWLEGLRRSLLGQNSLPPPLEEMGHGQLTLMLAGTTGVLVVGALLFFRWSQWRAWRLGKFDQTSGY